MDSEKRQAKKEKFVTEVGALYKKISWLNSHKMQSARFEGYKSPEVHCIEYIGKHEDVNVTKLAEAFYLTRGAISKMTKKIIAKGGIESYQKPGNKKEVCFRLTAQGKEILKIHEGLHDEFEARDQVVYDQLPEEHLDIMLDFVENYIQHLDQEITKAGIGKEGPIL